MHSFSLNDSVHLSYSSIITKNALRESAISSWTLALRRASVSTGVTGGGGVGSRYQTASGPWGPHVNLGPTGGHGGGGGGRACVGPPRHQMEGFKKEWFGWVHMLHFHEKRDIHDAGTIRSIRRINRRLIHFQKKHIVVVGERVKVVRGEAEQQ